MYLGQNNKYNYKMPVMMVTDTNLDDDAYFHQTRPIIMHHAIGNTIEQLCREVINPANAQAGDYGNTECVLMETWTLPDMSHLVASSSVIVTSADGVTTGKVCHPYTIYHNQAYPTPPTFVKQSVKTVSPGSDYRLLSYGFASSGGWGVPSEWQLTESGSYSTTPLAMKIDLKTLFSLLKTRFASETMVYIILDYVGVLKVRYDNSRLETSAGMQVLLSERRIYTQGGALTNTVAFKKSSSSYNLGAGEMFPVTPNNNIKAFFTAHGMLKGLSIGSNADYSSARTWEMEFIPIIPTTTDSSQSGPNYGLWRPCIRVSVCCIRP